MASPSARRSRSRSLLRDSSWRRTASSTRLDALLADPDFRDDPAARDAKLAEFRDDHRGGAHRRWRSRTAAAKLAADYPGHDDALPHEHQQRGPRRLPLRRLLRLAHRRSGRLGRRPRRASARPGRAPGSSAPSRSARTTASITSSVGMALLVHHNFPDEEANGVAVTANPFDPAGLQPGVLRQRAGRRRRRGRRTRRRASPATSSSTYYTSPNQPVTYLTHSSLITERRRRS